VLALALKLVQTLVSEHVLALDTGTGFKANTSAGFGTGTGTGFGLVLASVLAKYWLRGLC